MQTQKLGTSPLEVSRIALGCMRLSEDRREAMASIRAALDQGINFFDHADVYGGGRREETFSAIWDEMPGLRDAHLCPEQVRHPPRRRDGPAHRPRATISATSTSWRRCRDRCNGSRPITWTCCSCTAPIPWWSRRKWPAPLTSCTARGQVRYFGVSNHTAAQMALLQRWVQQPLGGQPARVEPAAHGHAGRGDRDEPRHRHVDAQRGRPWNTAACTTSPSRPGGRWPAGALGKAATAPNPRLEGAAAIVNEMAAEKGVSPEAIQIAWLLRHPARIQPIIGTMNPARIASACQADGVSLSRESGIACSSPGAASACRNRTCGWGAQTSALIYVVPLPRLVGASADAQKGENR